MQIIDNQQLIPDYDILKKIIDDHPFNKNLSKQLNTITIVISEQAEFPRENIEFDDSHTNVKLGIGRSTPNKSSYEYLLYHEFGHAADRLTPEFRYSDDKKASLAEKECFIVDELWNLYIDARLHKIKFFNLGYQPPEFITIGCKRKLRPDGIEGKLLSHMS